jgi:response regulator of citrate/malate metabolism
MRLTAKEVSDRTGMSYVVASGFLAYLNTIGKATVEKRIAGKGRPTLIYSVDQHTIFDFGIAQSEAA